MSTKERAAIIITTAVYLVGLTALCSFWVPSSTLSFKAELELMVSIGVAFPFVFFVIAWLLARRIDRRPFSS